MALVLDIFAYGIDKEGKQVGSVSYIENTEDVEEIGCDEITLHKGYQFALAPRPVTELERST